MALRPSSRFAEVYRTGMRSRRGGLVVVEADGRSPRPEVGVVAGRRVGNAVRRNRAKRRLREAAHLMPLHANRAYVFIASPEVVDVSFSQLVEWMRSALDQLGAPEEGTA